MVDIPQVRRIARLAQLKLSESEVDELREHLQGMLEYFRVLDTIDTNNVEPMSHSLSSSNAFGADEPQPGLTVAQGLSNAPDQEGDQVRVPAVIEQV